MKGTGPISVQIVDDKYPRHQQRRGKKRTRSNGSTQPSEQHTQRQRLSIAQKVLLVDDNFMQRCILQNMLQTFVKEVQTAENGADAVEKIDESLKRKLLFDVIIMDHLMPGINGLETIIKINQLFSQKNNRCRPLFISYSGEIFNQEMEKAYRNAHCGSFLHKPVSKSVLEKTIRSAIS